MRIELIAFQSCLDSPHLEEYINHPVHISQLNKASSFIPFCSFGGEILGESLGEFRVPVCRLFREKVVQGRLCYEARLERGEEGKGKWRHKLESGLSFVIDTNYEYDVRRLLTREDLRKLAEDQEFFAYKQQEGGNNFTVIIRKTFLNN